jgi:GNAT superfamily N-acetyltransferase
MAVNEYDSMLESMSQTQSSDQRDPASSYDDILNSDKAQQKQALQASMMVASGADPDRQAQVQKLSQQTKLPPEIVDRNFDEIQKRAFSSGLEYDKLIDQNPALSTWLARPDNAVVAKDDIPHLSDIEGKVKEYNTLTDMYNGLRYGMAKLSENVANIPATLYDVAAYPQNLLYEAMGSDKRVQAPAWARFGGPGSISEEMAQKVPELSDSVSGALLQGDYAKAGRALAVQLFSTAPLMTSAMLAGPVGGPALFGATTTAESGRANFDQGVDPAAGVPAALGKGAVAVGVQNAFGIAGILGSWEGAIARQYGKPITSEVLKDLSKTLAYAVGGEGLAQAGMVSSNDVIDYLSGINRNALDGIGGRVADALIMGGATGGLMLSPQAVGLGVARAHELRQAQMQKDFFLSLGNSIESANLKQRLPEKMQDFVEHVTQGGPVENVYVPVEAMDKYFQDAKLNPAKAAQDLGILDEYNHAKETGADIQVPLSKWAQNIAGTDHMKGLSDDVKFSPDAKTVNEAKASDEQTAAEMVKLDQEARAEAEARAQSVQSVTEDVRDKLKEAGYSAKEAGHQADLYGAFFESMANKTGLSPEDIYKKYGLRIRSQDGSPLLAADTQVMSQPPARWQEEGYTIGENREASADPETYLVIQAKDREGNKVGDSTFKKENGLLRSLDVSVDPEHRRKGLASAMYSEAERQTGLTIKPTAEDRATRTEDGNALWSQPDRPFGKEKLRQAGTVLDQSAAASKLSPLGFYSQLESDVGKMDFKDIPAQDLAGRIKNLPGIKSDELETTGVLDWLKLLGRKVSKDEVIQFLKEKGVKLEQVVLGEDFQGNSDAPGVGDLDWSEPERDQSSDTYNSEYESESEYYSSSEYWDEERTKELRDELLPDYTDENGHIDEQALDKAFKEAKEEKADELTREYIESDEYHGAQFTVKESNTGWKLYGSDETGWYSPETEKSYDDLNEAKVKLSAEMIRRGEIAGDIASLIRPKDIRWSEAVGHKPVPKTLKKKIDEYFEAHKEELLKKAKEEDHQSYPEETPEENQKALLRSARYYAEEAIEAQYADTSNSRNKVEIQLKHGLLDGKIIGNDKKGYEFTIYGKKERPSDGVILQENTTKLEAKSLADARKEAIQVLLDKKMITPDQDHTAEGFDVNAPTGKSKWHKYAMEGDRQNYREVLLTLPDGGGFSYDTHFSQENVLAHVRVSDRTDSEGRKLLMIEELQSDWHQQGREKGYKDKPAAIEQAKKFYGLTDEAWTNLPEQERQGYLQTVTSGFGRAGEALSRAVPDAPYKATDAWSALAMKRMLRMAVEQGYDAIAWTPGQVHVDRWGTDQVGWTKKSAVDTTGWHVGESSDSRLPFTVYDAHGEPAPKSFDFQTKEKAEEWIKAASKDHWLVGSTEQRGGRADGMNIEELARARGELLEKNGERVTTRDELKKVVADTLGRERNDRSLDSLTDSIWKQMQEKDSGEKAPRKEGMEFFYDNLLPKKVMPGILKKLDKEAKVTVGKVDAGNDLTAPREYTGPDYTIAELAVKKADAPNVTVSRQIRDIQIVMRDHDLSFSEAMKGYGSDATAQYLGGKLSEIPKKIQDVWEVPITPEMKARIEHGFTLFQDGKNDGPRGQISFGPDKQFNIDLFKSKDQSTFLHESGHFFLEVMGDLSQHEGASEDLKSDYDTVLKWLGVESRDQIGREQHEQFARGFEAYLMEGKAPTSALRKAFNTFKTWLIHVYTHAKNLNVEMSDEVRGVMDRLLSSGEETTQAQSDMHQEPLFTDPKSFGMNDKMAARYEEAKREAREYSEAHVRKYLMDDLLKKQRMEYKAAYKDTQSKVYDELKNSPEYKAIETMRESDLKLNRDAISEAFGKDALMEMPRGTTAKDGVPIEIAAEMLGFKNAEELISALRGKPALGDAIKAETERRMQDTHPDHLHAPEVSDEAVKAVHNDKRAQMLRLELEHLASNNMPVLKDAIRRVAKRVPSEEVVRAQAESIVGSRLVADLKPNLYKRAEIKSAREAAEALARGDIDQAFEAKRRELLNHELYRKAQDAKDEVDSQVRGFKRLFKKDQDLATSRDMNLINAARAILSEHGITRAEKTADDYLGSLKSYDPDQYQTVKALVDQASEQATGDYTRMSYDAFSNMKDAVNALWDLSKSIRENLIDGKKVERSKIVEDLRMRADELSGGRDLPGYTQAVSDGEKSAMGFLGWRARMRRAEHWAYAMDKGDVLGGAFTTYIVRPIKDAETRYNIARMNMLKEIDAIAKEVPKDNPKNIKAPELGPKGYTFTDKNELRAALLHTGNESNLYKLLVGRGWGFVQEDGSLDRMQWDKFIARMHTEGVITKADWDFAQKVWDLNEKYKPDAQKAHKDMYGYYFNEVTANPFETPFGQYDGGYMPAIVDPYMSEDQQVRMDKESLEKFNNSFMFPTTGRGFTKSRVENYAAPLMLDLEKIPSNLNKVLRFTHLEPTVKEVARIINDRGFRESMTRVDPAVVKEMLVPWLQRSALQSVVMPSEGYGGKQMDKAFSTVRQRASLQVMALNVANWAENLAQISNTMVRVGPGHVAGALMDYARSPKEMSAMIQEKSDFMKTKLGDNARDLMKHFDELVLSPSKFEKANEMAKKFAYLGEHAANTLMETIAWAGAYRQAVAEGHTEIEAVRLADSTTRQVAVDFSPSSVSRYETGSPFVRLFTMFSPYFNTMANLLGSELSIAKEMGLRTKAGGIRAAKAYALIMLVPAIAGNLIKRIFSGQKVLDENDDGHSIDDFLDIFGMSQLRLATAMIPGGTVVNSFLNRFNANPYDDRVSVSPVVSSVETSISAVTQSVPHAISTGQDKSKAIKEALVAIGLATGLPTGLVARPAAYMSDVKEGKARPTGPIDYTRGLLTGKPGKSHY